MGLSFKHTSRLKKAVFVYYENMETETNTEEDEPNRENMTLVYLGEVAVWVTVWEFYAEHNR